MRPVRDDAQLDPAEVQPTDNSSGAPPDLNRVEEIEDELQQDDA